MDQNNIGDTSLLLKINQKLTLLRSELTPLDAVLLQKSLTELDRLTPELNRILTNKLLQSPIPVGYLVQACWSYVTSEQYDHALACYKLIEPQAHLMNKLDVKMCRNITRELLPTVEPKTFPSIFKLLQQETEESQQYFSKGKHSRSNEVLKTMQAIGVENIREDFQVSDGFNVD